MTVKLTKEQDEAIRCIRLDKEWAVRRHANGFEVGEFKHLNKLSLDQLIRCLYMKDYEVEPEFEIGDYVYSKTWEKVGRVTLVNKTTITTERFQDELKYIRHATESEIQQEKERRFWAGLNRKSNQYEMGDICFDPDGGIGIVTGYESKSAYNNFLVELNEWTSFDSDELTLISPVEQRLDVNHDD